MQLTNQVLSPYRLNDHLTLANRILMAPMTRNMADNDLVPTAAMASYYAKRAAAGLIITEGTIIRPDSKGYSNVPGIFTPAQIDSWQRVTDAVHQQNGKIFCQIWHVGRVTHPFFLNGELPVSASATVMTGPVRRAENLMHGESRALSLAEIRNLIDDYAIAALNAINAGFDGIEIHGANGYLIDQFLHAATNWRQDEYGSSPENNAQFALEIVRACSHAIGCHRVGLRLSPGAYLNQIVGEAQDALTFQYLLTQLNDLSLAYVHTGNFDDTVKFAELQDQTMTQFMRTHYQGHLVACGGYSLSRAQQSIATNQFDLVAMGRPFIANPNLITLLENNAELKAYDIKMLESLA